MNNFRTVTNETYDYKNDKEFTRQLRTDMVIIAFVPIAFTVVVLLIIANADAIDHTLTSWAYDLFYGTCLEKKTAFLFLEIAAFIATMFVRFIKKTYDL